MIVADFSGLPFAVLCAEALAFLAVWDLGGLRRKR